jgi:Fe2+ transport system protein FeoA
VQPLSLGNAEAAYVVVSNRDRKTVGMGICAGTVVRVLRNDADAPNMVIAVGHARYAISKATTDQILVRYAQGNRVPGT